MLTGSNGSLTCRPQPIATVCAGLSVDLEISARTPSNHPPQPALPVDGGRIWPEGVEDATGGAGWAEGEGAGGIVSSQRINTDSWTSPAATTTGTP